MLQTSLQDGLDMLAITSLLVCSFIDHGKYIPFLKQTVKQSSNTNKASVLRITYIGFRAVVSFH